MGAVWMRARAELRARWRAWVALVVLVALGSGLAMAAAAGARRSASAFSRLVTASRSADLYLPLFSFAELAQLDVAEVAALPQVADFAVVTLFASLGGDVGILASSDEGYGTRIDRPKLLSGRYPDPDSVDEVLLPFFLAESLGASVDSTLPWTLPPPEGRRREPKIRLKLRVVGISVNPLDFPGGSEQVNFTSTGPRATPAFRRAYAKRADSFQMLAIRLHPGQGAAFDRELDRLARGKQLAFTISLADLAANTQRSIGLQATALRSLALLLGVMAALILGQAIARQSWLDAADSGKLRALGMTGAQQSMGAIVRVVLVALSGSAAGCGIAVVLSPLMPFGLARIAEPAPGFSIDAGALGTGAVLTVAILGAFAAAAGWRASRQGTEDGHTGTQRSSKVAGAMARAGFGVSLVSGVGMALNRERGRAAIPIRSTLMGTILGVGTITMALGFGAGLDHLIDTPQLWGAVIDVTYFRDEGVEPFLDEVRTDPRVEAFSSGSGADLQIDGKTMSTLLQVGSLTPPILEGRAPGGPNVDQEILLGTETLRDLGKQIGDEVTVTIPGVRRSIEATIVGRTVFPPITQTLSLGKGAFMSPDGVAALVPGAPTQHQELTMRFAPGVDREAAIADYDRLFGSDSGDTQLRLPEDLLNFGRVANLPVILASGLVLLAFATLVHTLLTSVRRRRRDLALLRTLGMLRRQTRRTVWWQAVTLVSIGLAVGLPAGVAAGRWLWHVFANRVGVVPEPVVPGLAVGLIAPIALVLTYVITALPARAAARTKPAIVLRSE